MSDAQILNLLGVEVELRVWRGRDNLLEAVFTTRDGTPISLANSDVTLTVTDRAGGTIKYSETKTPADHTNAAGGVTRLSLPKSVFAELTEQRHFTWKYQIIRRDRTTGAQYQHFYGDLRVYAPYASAPSSLDLSVGETVSLSEST